MAKKINSDLFFSNVNKVVYKDFDSEEIPKDFIREGWELRRNNLHQWIQDTSGKMRAIKCPAIKAWCQGVGEKIGESFNCFGCPYLNGVSKEKLDMKKEEPTTQQKIRDIMDAMKDLLLYKNQKYGDSAINPKKIFYKGDSTNSILIRLDDKLGRVMSNTEEKPRVNDVADIIGYCTLLLISMGVMADDISKFKD